MKTCAERIEGGILMNHKSCVQLKLEIKNSSAVYVVPQLIDIAVVFVSIWK